jgi:hypothetical protein
MGVSPTWCVEVGLGPFGRTPAGTGSCAGSKDEGSDTRRRRPTPARALAVEGRRSNLQGRDDVEGRRSERRGQVPLGRHAPSDKGEVRSLGLESDEHRLVVGRVLVFLWSPLRRQVFVVVISQRSRRQDGSGSPKIIDQGPNQEKDQKGGAPVHLQGCPLVEAIANAVCKFLRPLEILGVRWPDVGNRCPWPVLEVVTQLPPEQPVVFGRPGIVTGRNLHIALATISYFSQRDAPVTI